ncbi:hypothetical protein [Ureibacillus thermosphaericus]|uniref:Uncharacterized protein n=1 Tax=Ureibacillus thermosphaericus TaxID=51173 RepID=A0A840PUW4_URETH|nr:hypothetical protein [Ureibacillus thermosphaericus]MBB5148522.1 hypothetical protein [Ureibacillus thermosphaericus]NKZ31014.1 hypothetical protein [Ureibacillus thermosphaericus]
MKFIQTLTDKVAKKKGLGLLLPFGRQQSERVFHQTVYPIEIKKFS